MPVPSQAIAAVYGLGEGGMGHIIRLGCQHARHSGCDTKAIDSKYARCRAWAVQVGASTCTCTGHMHASRGLYSCS